MSSLPSYFGGKAYRRTNPSKLWLMIIPIVTFFWWIKPSRNAHQVPIHDFGLAENENTRIHEAQKSAYLLAGDKARPTCSWTSRHATRYASLRSSNDSSVFLALNLMNNQDVLPTFFQELPLLLYHLDPRQVYISIYENGSTDKTPALLELLGELLAALRTPHKIVSLGTSSIPNKDNGRRILVLAAARNAALEPLYSGTAAQTIPRGTFDDLLFMNDVFFCAADILEVLYQKRMQHAHQACAVDWGSNIVYDRWIIRTMSGRPFYNQSELIEYFNGPPTPDGSPKPIPSALPLDAVDRAHFESLRPFQVFSCWNGATAFDASAFIPPNGIRFRTALNDLDENSVPKAITEKASECYLPSVDLWKKGLGKVLLVPKAGVAYNMEDYNKYRHDELSMTSRDERVEWVAQPPKKVAQHDWAQWYAPERWAAWDEP